MIRPAVLVDERDNRIGKTMVGDSCFVIQHGEAVFYRTAKAVKLHHSHRTFAVVFEQTEILVRNKLESV